MFKFKYHAIIKASMGHRPETMNAQQTFELRAEAFANGYAFNNPNATAEEKQAYWDNVIMIERIIKEPCLSGINADLK